MKYDDRSRQLKYPVESILPRSLIALLLIIFILIFFNCIFKGQLPGPFNWLYYWVPWNRPGMQGQGGNFIISDQMDQFLPMLNFTKESLKSGLVPWWNSQLIFGFPFFALFICGHIYPLSAVSLLFPIEFYWIICASLKFFFIGYFTFALLRLYKVKTDAAFFGAIVSMFSLYSVVWAGDFLSHSFSAVPFFFYSLTKFFKQKISTRNRLLVITSSCFMLTGSFPSVSFYAVFTAGLYVLFLFGAKVFSRKFLELVLLGLVSVLICCIPLFYTAEFLSLMDLGYRKRLAGAHLPLKNLIQIILPEAYGNYIQMTDSRMGNYNETSSYFGSIPLFLSFLNISFLFLVRSYRKNSFVIFWTIIQLWSFAMVYNLFDILSVFSKAPIFGGNPSTRMLVLLVFSSTILSSIALYNLRMKIAKKRRVSAFLSILLAGIMFLAFIYTAFHFAIHDQLVFGHWKKSTLIFIAGALILSSFFIYMSGARKSFASLVLTLLVFSDLYLYGNSYNGFYTKDTFYSETDSIKFLKDNMQPGQKIITLGKQFLPQTPLFYGVGSAQSRWFLTENQIERLRDLDPEYRSIHKTSHFFRTVPMDGTAESLKLLNVRYLIVDRDHYGEYLRDPNKFKIAGHFDDRTTIFENLDRRFLSEDPESECNDEKVYNFNYKNDELVFVSNRCQAGSLTLPVWDYPGWSLIQGDAQKTVDGDLIALDLPAGKQIIKLSYKPSGFGYALAATFVGVLLAVFMVFKRI